MRTKLDSRKKREARRLWRAAAKGAAFLDEKDPGWARAIDVDSLQIMGEDACLRCILGQRFGSYLVGALRLDIDDREAELGFLSYCGVLSFDVMNRVLTRAWIVQIRKRTEVTP